MGTTINYKAVLLYGLLIGAVVVALLYFLSSLVWVDKAGFIRRYKLDFNAGAK
jgi:hypothetical protein